MDMSRDVKGEGDNHQLATTSLQTKQVNNFVVVFLLRSSKHGSVVFNCKERLFKNFSIIPGNYTSRGKGELVFTSNTR